MQAEHCCTSTTAESRAKFWYQYNAFKSPGGIVCCLFKGDGSVVVDLLLNCYFHCGIL